MKEKVKKVETLNYGAGRFFEIKISEVGKEKEKILFFSKGWYAGKDLEKKYIRCVGIPFGLIDDIVKILEKIKGV